MHNQGAQCTCGPDGGVRPSEPPPFSATDPDAVLIRGGDVAAQLRFLAIEIEAVLSAAPTALHESELDEIELLSPPRAERSPALREQDAPVLEAEGEVARDELQLLGMKQVSDLTEQLAHDDAPVAHDQQREKDEEEDVDRP